MLVSERIGQFFFDGHRIEFTEYAAGDRLVVLLHGELMSRSMHQPLARRLAMAGNRVVTVDLLGHGRSDRPEDPTVYSLTAFAHQVVALLDHLGVERAVIGGTSLGSNIALEVAVEAPDRVQGLVIEMPVLENALAARIATVAPLLFVGRVAPVLVSGVRAITRAVPRGVVPFWVGVGLDTCNQRPGPLTAALHGILFGRTAPSSAQRSQIEAPALIVGHPHDPIHPAADAVMLAEELPDNEFVEARSILEWRVRPERITQKCIDFLDRVFVSSAAPRRLSSRR